MKPIDIGPYRELGKQAPECYFCRQMDDKYTKAIWEISNEWFCNSCADECFGDI